MKPLEGLIVIEFSQFLSGSSASLRLADLGARVIRIERPGIRNIDRVSYVNRNKESYAADLKNPDGLAKAKELIGRADVMSMSIMLADK